MEIKQFSKCKLGTYEYLTGDAGTVKLNKISRDLLRSNKVVAVDLETSGLYPMFSKILLFSICFEKDYAYVFSPEEVDITPFLEVLEKNPIANHGIKFDYRFLKYHYGIDVNVFWDTMVVHGISTAGISMSLGGNSLANLCKRYLGVTLDKDIRKSFLSDSWKSNETLSYAANDSIAVLNLIEPTKRILEVSKCVNIWEEIERPLIPVLVDMELSGVPLDLEYTISLRDKYQEDLNKLNEEIFETTKYEEEITATCKSCRNGSKKKLTCVSCGGAGKITSKVISSVNPGSPKQLIDYFESLGVVVPLKERKNGPASKSVDDENLHKIDHPFAKRLLEYRKIAKSLSAFLIPWTTPSDTDEGNYNTKTGCIHAEVTQSDTSTGRTSYRNPKKLGTYAVMYM